jgi:hypothetical protein
MVVRHTRSLTSRLGSRAKVLVCRLSTNGLVSLELLTIQNAASGRLRMMSSNETSGQRGELEYTEPNPAFWNYIIVLSCAPVLLMNLRSASSKPRLWFVSWLLVVGGPTVHTCTHGFTDINDPADSPNCSNTVLAKSGNRTYSCCSNSFSLASRNCSLLFGICSG